MMYFIGSWGGGPQMSIALYGRVNLDGESSRIETYWLEMMYLYS